MSEKHYPIGRAILSFSEVDDIWGCLCTFPNNDEAYGELVKERVASLALFGAAVILSLEEKSSEELYLPNYVPDWMCKSIREALGLGNGE